MKKRKTTDLSDTKPNNAHTYYQYIHPCNLHKAKYDYRYLGVVKNGELYDSEPFESIDKCHEALQRFIENDETITSTPTRRKRKST